MLEIYPYNRIYKTRQPQNFMFGSLKEKLKGWIKKVKEETEEEIIEEAPKKTKDKKKPTAKKKPTPKKSKEKEVVEDQVEEITEEPIVEEEEIIEEKVVEEEEEIEEEPKQKKSFFSSFKKTLTEEKFDELFEELELILLQSNTAYEAVDAIKSSLKESLVGKTLKEVDIAAELKSAIENLLINPPDFIKTIKDSLKEKAPYVILFSGINGSGKTTTVAKVADLLIKNNLTVCLAAADTFRAASIEQIQVHADKLGIPLIKKDYGIDPAAVGFDAIKYAKKNNIQVVLIDTAGRMQNKDSLMQEMEKISRVNKPDMRIFLGESITGNDATLQAKAFDEALDLTGIILSKADVDEKGGTAISVSHITKKPILFLGTGQEYKDLEVFNKESLIKKLGL